MEKIKVSLTSFYFIFYLLIFIADCIANYFTKVPILVSYSLLFLPIIATAIKFKNQSQFDLSFLFIVSLLISLLINQLRFGFSEKNISDFIMLLSFVISYNVYSNNRESINQKNINWFLMVCLLLFYVSFLGIDNNRWGNTLNADSNDLEYLRQYRQGLFRVAHIAAYFFSFLAIYFFYLFDTFKTRKHLFISILLLTTVLLIGSRAPIFALIFGFLVANFRVKYLKYVLLIVVLVILVIVNIEGILSATQGNVLFQYFSFFKTIISNFSRLSRVLIWTSFFEEVGSFNFSDIFIGRGVENAMIANEQKRLGRIWFHNDFLNIFYSFGFINFALYILCFINIYKGNRLVIKNNSIIASTYIAMVFLAFVNGFYLYYVMFLFYIIYRMISMEELKIKKEKIYD